MERQNILNFLEKTKTLILVHKKMESISQSKNMINILLSPQFYTLKREALPVKYAYQAKRIAPSLFEGLLEDTQGHKYFVSKEEDTWLFIAYDEEIIKNFLEEKQIDLARINKIYFAEQSLHAFTSPVLMGEEDALVDLHGTVTIVPQVALSSEVEPIRLNEQFIPKKGISLEDRGASYINTKEAYAFAAMFILFAGIYVVEGVKYKGESALEKEEMIKLLDENPSLESSYKRESILSKYRIIDKKERKKREAIKVLSRMNFKGSTLISLAVNNKRFEAQFDCQNTKAVNQLNVLAKEAKFNIGTLKNNKLTIEGLL